MHRYGSSILDSVPFRSTLARSSKAFLTTRAGPIYATDDAGPRCYVRECLAKARLRGGCASALTVACGFSVRVRRPD